MTDTPEVKAYERLEGMQGMGSPKGRIILNCFGGLGNQLFMYAAGLYFASKCGHALEIVKPELGRQKYGEHSRPFQLDQFGISEPIRTAGILDRLLFSRRQSMAPWRSLVARSASAELIDEATEYCFQPPPAGGSAARRTYMSGYWQAAGYAQSDEHALRERLTFRYPPSATTREFAGMIQRAGNSVSVHLRYGDYAQIFHKNGNCARVSNILPFSYYQQAIEVLRQSCEGLVFIVFSDEPKTARALMGGVTPCLFIDGNGTANAHEDLWLMSLCRHNIISNSSFSWWGAWLNASHEKRVFAPRYWHNTTNSYFADLYPDGWTLIDNLDETGSKLPCLPD